MSTAQTAQTLVDSGTGQNETFFYRAVSKSAVASVILMLISPLAYAWPQFAIFPLIGAVLGVTGWTKIRRMPNELSGAAIATVGSIACTFIFLTSVGFHSVIYATEVPEGYERIHFASLEMEKGTTIRSMPQEIAEIHDKQIFVKGYVHPGVSGLGEIRHFILVEHFKTCCFGGQPEPTDMIEVRIEKGDGIEYNRRLRRVTGKFRIQPRRKIGDVQTGYYSVTADNVK